MDCLFREGCKCPPSYSFQFAPEKLEKKFEAKKCSKMSKYRGFTVSFNAIGAGKTTRKYLLLAISEYLTPLLDPANKNMIEAKCSCQLVINTRSVYRRGSGDYWVKYQLIVVIAPTRSKHEQAKRLIENLLPGSVDLTEYHDTASARLQCNEFVPDNKPLVYGYQRVGIARNTFGEVDDLKSPAAPTRDRETGRLAAPWLMTKRERNGVFLTTKNFPLQRKLNIVNLLDMLLLGVGDRENSENQSNAELSNNNVDVLEDEAGLPRHALSRRRGRTSAMPETGLKMEKTVTEALAATSDFVAKVVRPPVSFGCQ